VGRKLVRASKEKVFEFQVSRRQEIGEEVMVVRHWVSLKTTAYL
jgi:hypothetical protein